MFFNIKMIEEENRLVVRNGRVGGESITVKVQQEEAVW